MWTKSSATNALKFLARRHKLADTITGTDGITQDEQRTAIRNSLITIYRDLERLDGPSDEPGDKENIWGWDSARAEAIKHLKQSIPADRVNIYLTEADRNLQILPSNPSRTPYHYWCVARDLQILRYFMSLHRPDVPLPIFDIVDLRHFNAFVQRFEQEYVLVFQIGTRGLANLFAKTFVKIWMDICNKCRELGIQSISPTSLLDLLKTMETVKILKTVFYAYLFLGDPHAGEAVSLNHQYRMAAWLIELGMNRFIIAHEYAHIVNQHDGSREKRYDQEVEADRSAILLMLESAAAVTNDPVLPFCGAHIAVAVQQKIAQTVSCILDQPFTLNGYPSAFARTANIMGACERCGWLTSTMESMALEMLSFVDSIYSLIEPDLLDTAKRGRPLAKLWLGEGL